MTVCSAISPDQVGDLPFPLLDGLNCDVKGKTTGSIPRATGVQFAQMADMYKVTRLTCCPLDAESHLSICRLVCDLRPLL